VIVGYGLNPSGQTEGWIADLTPSLSIRQRNNEVVVSWSTNAAGYILQETTALSTSNAWSSVSGPRGVAGDQYAVTNKTDLEKRFYRLMQP
jgi:hypothetical protein